MAFKNSGQRTFAYYGWQKEADMENINLSKELVRRKAELNKIKLELGKVNQVLDIFVYSISHNIRQPLTSILGLINLAKHEYVSSHNVSPLYHQLMESSILKLDETLKEIQDYSESARKVLEIKKIDLEELLEERYDQLRSHDGFISISKDFRVDQQCPFYTDPYLLSLIITNILSNAIKFHDNNKESRFIAVAVTVKKDFCYINITDNGIGINPTYLPKVFEMFFRANTIKEGAGLGLSIAKEAVIKLDGHISIASRIGEGTEVRIQLPNKVKPYSN